VNPKRPKVAPIHSPTLFEMEKEEEAATPSNTLPLDRPFSLPDILLGTSAFTANGWEGSFYPRGMQSRDFRPVNPDEHQQAGRQCPNSLFGTSSYSPSTLTITR
jgi:hypothetical protein